MNKETTRGADTEGSWGVYITGDFDLVNDISEEDKEDLLLEIEDTIGTKVKWVDDFEYYVFDCVRWASYTNIDVISRMIKKHNHLFKYFGYDVYYLQDPNEVLTFYRDEGKIKITLS